MVKKGKKAAQEKNEKGGSKKKTKLESWNVSSCQLVTVTKIADVIATSIFGVK
jgi:hypothetical protein